MKSYVLKVEIREGSDEFWEGLGENHGIQEVISMVREALANHGFMEPDCKVELTHFEYDRP